MILLVLVALVAGGLTGLPGSAISKSMDSIPTLTVCEALSHAAEYDGKVVRIRDQVVGTSEGTAFLGETCPGIYVTDSKVWPSAIAWTMPTAKGSIIHPVDFSYDWSSDKKVKRKWRKLRTQMPDRCIAVVFTGMFESWSNSAAKKIDPGGHYEISGFGHLNAAPAQLVLRSADDVAPIMNCK